MDVPTIPARSIVIKNKSTAWFGTRYTMNIYRGCSHGCIYCDSRSECYGVQDFDTVRVKSDALAVIRNDLRSKTQSGVVATGSMSDPYNPFEKELQLTRHALELLDAYGFGAAVATKGTLITRDADILREIASHSPVLCKITVTTCDDALAAKLEPRAPSSSALAHTVNGRSVAGGRAIPGSSNRSRGRLPANQSLEACNRPSSAPRSTRQGRPSPPHSQSTLLKVSEPSPESTRSAPPRSRINMPGILRCKKGTCPNRFSRAA